MASTPNKYSIAATDGGKVRIVCDPTWEPLTFYCSSDKGTTFSPITAESYENTNGSKTYRVPAAKDDIIKVVRGGGGPKIILFDGLADVADLASMVTYTNGRIKGGTIVFDDIETARFSMMLIQGYMGGVSYSNDGGETFGQLEDVDGVFTASYADGTLADGTIYYVQYR